MNVIINVTNLISGIYNNFRTIYAKSVTQDISNYTWCSQKKIVL